MTLPALCQGTDNFSGVVSPPDKLRKFVRALTITAEVLLARAPVILEDMRLSISGLARRLRIARQSAHALVANLDRRGLVRLSPNPEDRRLIQIEITRNGKEALHAAELRLHQWLQIMTVDLDDRELCRLIQTLRAIRGRIARSRDYA
jgi:DNA-binding MarR family transcriptional regulator